MIFEGLEVMSLKERIRLNVERHGLTWHGFWVCLLVFPPAGIVIAWLMPRVNPFIRLILTLLCVGVMLIAPAVIGTLAYLISK